MAQHKNAKSKAPKGKPSSSQRGGNGLKDVVPEEEVRETIEDKYLDENGQPEENVKMRHENRNTDKGREDQGKDTISI